MRYGGTSVRYILRNLVLSNVRVLRTYVRKYLPTSVPVEKTAISVGAREAWHTIDPSTYWYGSMEYIPVHTKVLYEVRGQ